VIASPRACARARPEYLAIAPALFDRSQRNFETGYSADEIANARDVHRQSRLGGNARDTQAAIEDVKAAGLAAIVGFCMGGTVAFLAATRLTGLRAAVCS
jgi:carboxymethylenebutenolidase